MTVDSGGFCHFGSSWHQVLSVRNVRDSLEAPLSRDMWRHEVWRVISHRPKGSGAFLERERHKIKISRDFVFFLIYNKNWSTRKAVQSASTVLSCCYSTEFLLHSWVPIARRFLRNMYVSVALAWLYWNQWSKAYGAAKSLIYNSMKRSFNVERNSCVYSGSDSLSASLFKTYLLMLS